MHRRPARLKVLLKPQHNVGIDLIAPQPKMLGAIVLWDKPARLAR